MFIPPDIVEPGDQTHCKGCGEPLEEGDFCLRESKPVNDRAPFMYRARVWHWECHEKHMDEFWAERRRKRLADPSSKSLT